MRFVCGPGMRWAWFILLATILLNEGAGLSRGSETTTPPASDEAIAELIQLRVRQIEQSPGLDESTRKTLKTVYDEAQQTLAKVREWSEKTTQFAQTALHAPSMLEQTKAELAAQPAERTIVVPPEATIKEIEQAIVNRESELGRLRAELERLEAEPKRRAAQREQNAQRTGELRQTLSKLGAELQTPNDGRDPLADARRLLSWVQHRAAEQELLAIDRQAAAFEATAELLPVQRDLAQRRVVLAEQEIKQLQELVNARRQAEAARQAQTAKLDALRAHPAVRRLAEENAALAEKRKEIAQRITALTAQLEQTTQLLHQVEDQFKRAREKVDAVGLTNAIGLLLRKQRDALPNISQRRRDLSARQMLIAETQLTLLQLRDQRAESADVELRTQRMMAQLAGAAGVDSASLGPLVRDALRSQKDYLDALINDHHAYFDKLVDLDNAERRLVEATEQCARFIDERVLWITSDAPLQADDLRHGGDAAWWLLGPEGWAEMGRALIDDAVHKPAVLLLALLAIVPLIALRPALLRRLRELGEQVRKANCYRFSLTIHALALTLLVSAAWAAPAAYVGWRLAAPFDASELCKAVGTGLMAAARAFFVIQLIYVSCRTAGLAEAHFAWSESAVRALRHGAGWLRWPIAATAFLVASLDQQSNDRWDGSLGRLAFIAGLLLSSLALQRILRPGGGVFHQWLVEHRGGWLDRLRYLWYPAAVLVPIALALLAAVGYYYTAQQLAARLALTAYLAFAFVLLRSLLLRWILVSRRKLAIEEARRRRAQLEAAGDENPAELPTPAPAERDLAAINTQTRRLVEYTLIVGALLSAWMVWFDVTPALRFLNEVRLWETTVIESVVEKTPGGTIENRTVERPTAVTLANLILALVVLGMTVTAARNIPGLLELALLQHLPFDAGVRYACATVSRYLIVIVGLTTSCSMIGLSWSKVQWLVAAVGVGLGFGLQEIFANFVSGLIILLERPIRVGDVITVGEINGKVARIRMRATTIVDWDRKELIVPNKEFITGRVLNWTLSDQVNRLVINVGVAYGSDTQKTTELLLRAAKEHPLVLDDPAPQVVFHSFGSSSLDFVLRCFLPNMDNRNTVLHELNSTIDRLFREAGIEIAFPQQDVHIRTLPHLAHALGLASADGNATTGAGPSAPTSAPAMERPGPARCEPSPISAERPGNDIAAPPSPGASAPPPGKPTLRFDSAQQPASRRLPDRGSDSALDRPASQPAAPAALRRPSDPARPAQNASRQK